MEECRRTNVPGNGEEFVRDLEKADNAAPSTRCLRLYKRTRVPVLLIADSARER